MWSIDLNEPLCATEIIIGIGCQHGVTLATLAHAIDTALNPLGAIRVRGLVSHINKVSSESALLELAMQRGWPVRGYSVHALDRIVVPHPSARIVAAIGTPSVAEAAALCASNGGALLVPKQRYRGADGKSVTVAIARYNDTPSDSRHDLI
ncbi:cobalt-precorrin 5A hydrolase/cobalt-precorrin 5A hydrolase / precorrin-3B C17-methyltransferase [Allochromatium warmingii]|uniref:Cobalt-precorrin 5A hydrolase/cobalt-precorrin 5A hydrolase / precorrin-3B C17-methyltransferase n=1 Tax=Allochromatium warmingii TaxID=61595 RepID=A0A1H3ENE1_ALLWA|nr:cobalamin biosynthesis protein [Allochromatium warmingii]SDX80125.1 cobalt-precorrin 5A hydrolase/cobalt-precorrin 5A hydrolase / precorrin-3B C17-methyltransferase [Allochromatium warmingii]